MLRHYGVKPILVFDGGHLPMKNEQKIKRARYYFSFDNFYTLSYKFVVLFVNKFNMVLCIFMRKKSWRV